MEHIDIHTTSVKLLNLQSGIVKFHNLFASHTEKSKLIILSFHFIFNSRIFLIQCYVKTDVISIIVSRCLKKLSKLNHDDDIG